MRTSVGFATGAYEGDLGRARRAFQGKSRRPLVPSGIVFIEIEPA
ncbi:hypothetical protein AB0H86_10785 [Streptomyces sp. NPDC050997]